MDAEPAPDANLEKQPPRIVRTAALYFSLVFAVGLLLGPVRVLWLEPLLGAALATLCETPFLLAAMAFAGRTAPRWAGLRGGRLNYLWVGVLALAFQQISDLSVGFGLRGMTLSQQLAFFATPAGYIYAFDLLVFALAPFFMRSARRQDQAASS